MRLPSGLAVPVLTGDPMTTSTSFIREGADLDAERIAQWKEKLSAERGEPKPSRRCTDLTETFVTRLQVHPFRSVHLKSLLWEHQRTED
jgi:hypothetical protein